MTVRRDKKKAPGIYRRGSIWWLAITDSSRIRHFISLETKKLTEAIDRAEEIRSRPDIVAPGQWKPETEEYLRERVAEGRLSAMYARSRKTHLALFAKEHDIRTPSQVTLKMLQAWHDRRAKLNPNTAKHYVLHVRGFLAWLVSKNRLQTNPAANVRFHSRPARTRDVFVPREKVAELLDKAKGRDLLLILLLGFECGMRRTEICEARVEWLNLDAGTITIPRQTATFQRKNRRSSTVPLTSRCLRFFKAHKWPGPFLLRPEKAHGKHIYRVEFEDPFKSHLETNGCPGVNIHDMRRSFCSNRIAAGMSVEEVAFIVGDTPQVVWRNYARFIPATHRAELGAA